jgi:hypothetical protein
VRPAISPVHVEIPFGRDQRCAWCPCTAPRQGASRARLDDEPRLAVLRDPAAAPTAAWPRPAVDRWRVDVTTPRRRTPLSPRDGRTGREGRQVRRAPRAPVPARRRPVTLERIGQPGNEAYFGDDGRRMASSSAGPVMSSEFRQEARDRPPGERGRRGALVRHASIVGGVGRVGRAGQWGSPPRENMVA